MTTKANWISQIQKTPFVDIRTMGAKGDGVTDDYNAIVAAIALNKLIYFPEGTYLFKTPLVITSAIHFIGNGRNSKLKYGGTATTTAIYLNYTATPIKPITSRIENLQIDGNNLAVNGLHTKDSAKSTYRNLEIRNVSGIAFWAERATLDTIDQLEVSSQAHEAFTTTPTVGIRFDGNSGGNLLLNPRIENVGNGIEIGYAFRTTLLGGTSEGNSKGLVIEDQATWTVVKGLDLESNTVRDIEIQGGTGAEFHSVHGNSSSDSLLISGGFFSQFFGGYFDTITITAGAEDTGFFGTAYGTSGYSDSGIQTTKHGLWNALTGIRDADTPNGINSTNDIDITGDISLEGNITQRNDTHASGGANYIIDNEDTTGTINLYLTEDAVNTKYAVLSRYGSAYTTAAYRELLQIQNQTKPIVIGGVIGTPDTTRLQFYGSEKHRFDTTGTTTGYWMFDNENTAAASGYLITEDAGVSKYATILRYGSTHATLPGRLGFSGSAGTKFNFAGIAEYADNAAALTGGLVVGDVYRTGDVFKIVH